MTLQDTFKKNTSLGPMLIAIVIPSLIAAVVLEWIWSRLDSRKMRFRCYLYDLVFCFSVQLSIVSIVILLAWVVAQFS